MRPKLFKTGLIGSSITALCCFTPLLVWPLGALGLATLTGYLDWVLFPFLFGFILLTLIGSMKTKQD